MANVSEPDTGEEKDSIQVMRPAEGIVVLTIASEPLGVLRHAVKRTLMRILHELDQDPSVRCALLTGMGKAFSVGSDIRDFSQEPGWLLENDYWEAGLNQTVEEARFPIIAVCNGHTLGGGAVLALACDFRIASVSAKFGFPEVKVGAFASGSGTQRLPRLVGRGRALELLLTGRVIPAEEALRVGLVEFIYPDDVLQEKALELATVIASYPGGATAATKLCVNTGLRESWQTGLALESDLRLKTGSGSDAVEGREAFLEKREPKFNRSI